MNKIKSIFKNRRLRVSTVALLVVLMLGAVLASVFNFFLTRVKEATMTKRVNSVSKVKTALASVCNAFFTKDERVKEWRPFTRVPFFVSFLGQTRNEEIYHI